MLKSLFFKHKPEQGMVIRGTGLALIAALLLFGCYGLYYFVYSQADSLAKALITIPLVDLEINIALIVAVGVFCTGVWITAYFLGKPKTADLLIETETELAKVTWPSWAETVNASIVVIFTTAFMAGLLFVFDIVLRKITGIFL